MSRIIREARPTDVAEIMQVMDAAKKIMRQSGNMHQWGEGYPSEAVITADMERNGGFIIEDDGCIVGYFAFLPSPEPTYAKISEGEWLDETQPYHVVHRIASYPDAHGIFSSIMDFCFSHDTNIRIDTHRDNKIMQHNIQKHGFTFVALFICCRAMKDWLIRRLCNFIKIYFMFPISNRCLRDKSSGGSCHRQCRCFLP